jgi:hypothetical protein
MKVEIINYAVIMAVGEREATGLEIKVIYCFQNHDSFV